MGSTLNLNISSSQHNTNYAGYLNKPLLSHQTNQLPQPNCLKKSSESKTQKKLFISRREMSPALSLTTAQIPVFQCQDIFKDNHNKFSTRENLNQRTPPHANLSRRKLLQSCSTGILAAGLSSIKPVRAEPESPQESTSSRMSYTRFLEYLNEGAVKKVDLFENGTVAIAEISNPVLNRIQRVRVQLPGLPQELLRKLKEKEVDFAAHPVEPNYGLAILDFLANFGFPLLLLGSLFLRSSFTNASGGPNLPFGLGR